MALDKFVYIRSIDTSSLYTDEENNIHKKLLTLYKERKDIKEKNGDCAEINKQIKNYRDTLVDLLDEYLEKYPNKPRWLRQEAVNDKNIINLFCSDLTRNLNLTPMELSEDLIMLNVYFFQVFKSVIYNGFYYNGEKYVYLTSSAGQIRTKRGLFIKESAFRRIEKRLMCGLSIDTINRRGGTNTNKFLAYLALMNSATDVWENFDISKTIVVDDFETTFKTLVDYIDYQTYKIERKEMDVTIPYTDGWGIVDGETTRMIRMPWVKGLLVNFPLQEWLRKECPPDKWLVSDIYGVEHNIVLEDIRYIFTKSQFKMYKFYDSWEQYKDYFVAYGCAASYCNMEEEQIPQAKLNYQMLQQLNCMTDAEIDKIIAPTIDEITKIGNDYRTTMRILGATPYNKTPSYMQQALMIYPELFKDAYGKEILKQTKKSVVKKAKAGRLKVPAKYLFVSPNPLPFCRWLFFGEQNPKDEILPTDVYTNQYKDGDELAVMRSPSLGKEWCIRTNRRNPYLDRWLGKSKCIYTSCYDIISKILAFDNDGDKLLCIKERTLTNVAKRMMHDVVPIYYEMKKATGGLISAESIYNGISKAFTCGNIGVPSNLISIVHNNGIDDRDEADNVIKWLTMEVNYVIDGAKTLFFLTRPKDIDEIIKRHTKGKLPNFFMYAKDKLPSQVEKPNQSVMNRIASKIPSSRVSYSKTISRFDWTVLIKRDVGFETEANSPIVQSYEYWLRHQHNTFDYGDDEHIDQEDLYCFQQIRKKILAECGKDLDYVVNSLVAYLYTIKQSSNKKMLWACFGDVILKNIRRNVVDLGNICPVCGKRFTPRAGGNAIYCGTQCYYEAHKAMKKEVYDVPKLYDEEL